VSKNNCDVFQVISKVRGNWMRSRVLDIALKSKQPESEKYFNSNYLNQLIENI